MLRIITTLVVFVTGALLLSVDALIDRSTRLADYGFFLLIAGLVALTVELYIIPVFANYSSTRGK